MNDRQSNVVLGLLAALYAAALVLLAPNLDPFPSDLASDTATMLCFGLIFAAPPMLALWSMHGPAPAIRRMLATMWLLVAFFLATAYGQVRNYGQFETEILLMMAVGWLVAYACLLVPLGLLRAVRGWRLLAPYARPNTALFRPAQKRSGGWGRAWPGSGWPRAKALRPSDAPVMTTTGASPRHDDLSELDAAHVPGLPQRPLANDTARCEQRDADTQGQHEGPHRQFTIRALLLWTAAAAVLCAAVRALASYGSLQADDSIPGMLGEFAPEGISVGLMAALASLPALAAAWIVLTDGGRLVLRSTLSVATILGSLGGAHLFGKMLFNVPQRDGMTLILIIEAGVLIAALAAVSVMRACGYRLVRVSRKATAAVYVACGPRQLSQRRFAYVSAALGIAMLSLAAYAPRRFEVWRRADEIQRWLAFGWHATLDDHGRIVGLDSTGDQPLAGSEILLSQLPDLRSLDFNGSDLTDVQLWQYPIHCPAMAQLESLYMTGTAVGDNALSYINRFAHLKHLSLSGTQVTDEGLARLSALAELQSLDVSDTAVSLKQAPSLPCLERLVLDGADVDDVGLANLAAFPKLNFLRLGRTNITDTGIGNLRALTSLDSLDLSITDVTDEAIPALSQLTELRSVNLELTAVSESGLKALHKALPEADINVGASDELLRRVASTQPYVIRQNGVLGITMTALRRPPGTLKRLHARGNYPRGYRLGQMTVMQTKTVTDAGLWTLAGQATLEELDLRESAVTDAGLPTLAKLNGLKRLDLRGAAVTESGCATLAKALPGCTILR